MKTLGVLDLQGDVVEHIDHLHRLGINSRRVKKPEHLNGLAGLIIPGGESTCIWRLIKMFKLDNAIISAVRKNGLKVWGTCAGTILMAKEVISEEARLGLIDICIQRNAFGGQLDSFRTKARIKEVSRHELPLTFIRAPKILRAGAGVNILLKIEDFIVMAESAEALVTVFHPEMTSCLAFHRYFGRKCGVLEQDCTGGDETAEDREDVSWSLASWTKFTRIE